MVKCRIENGDMRYVRHASHGNFDADKVRRVVQWRKWNLFANPVDDALIDQCRSLEGFAPVYDTMADADQFISTRNFAGLAQRIGDPGESLPVVVHLSFSQCFAGVCVSLRSVCQAAPFLANSLQQARCQRLALLHFEQLVLDRRAARVQYEHFHDTSACAWIAVIATVFTISATLQPLLRSLTGLFKPCRTGPTATASAERCTAL